MNKNVVLNCINFTTLKFILYDNLSDSYWGIRLSNLNAIMRRTKNIKEINNR